MPALAIPDTGLQLESPANAPNSLPLQAFGLVLNDDVIEDMIRCVQNGQNLELCLGNNPSLRYGNQEQDIKPTPNSFDYDLFLTNPSESPSKAQKLPNPTMSIFKKFTPTKPVQSTTRAEKATKAGKGGKGSKILPPGKNAMSSVYTASSTTRSLPTSPAPNGVLSPSLNPAFTASQQKLEKNKEQRSVIVHELAVRDQTLEHLQSKWGGSESELKDVLGRVADLINNKWSMKKQFWKELDVWSYDYDSQDERQAAIDNAIKQYDKQRYSSTAPEWERLLKKADRGKGIVLSKLQDRLAKGNITPVPKAPKAEEAGKNSSDESSKSKGGEAMARSNSQPVASKPKAKASDRETQAKRLLSNNPKKPAPPKKSAPATKPKATDKGAKKVLSAEFVQDSSSSEDEVPLSASTKSKPAEKEKPLERVISKVAEKIVEKPKEPPAPASKPKEPPAPAPKPKEPPAPAPKAKAKTVVRAPKAAPTKTSTGTPKTAPKRSREEEDSSSSSGAPLAKRLNKTKEAPKPLSNTTALKHRPSDASQNSRVTASSNLSFKSKNTSPAKSSPLASSPPTNASDFDDDSHSQSQNQRQAARVNGVANGTAAVSKKRKDYSRDMETLPPTKKPRVSPSVLKKAQEFEVYYKRYETLHHELISVRDPPQEDLDRLLKMRAKLANLKDAISQEVSSAA